MIKWGRRLIIFNLICNGHFLPTLLESDCIDRPRSVRVQSNYKLAWRWSEYGWILITTIGVLPCLLCLIRVRSDFLNSNSSNQLYIPTIFSSSTNHHSKYHLQHHYPITISSRNFIGSSNTRLPHRRPRKARVPILYKSQRELYWSHNQIYNMLNKF